jgi:hypothetical protein
MSLTIKKSDVVTYILAFLWHMIQIFWAGNGAVLRYQYQRLKWLLYLKQKRYFLLYYF